MKKLIGFTIATAIAASSMSVAAQTAKSEKQAQKATELRQAIFKILGANMGPLGGMARGKVPFDAEKVAVNAERINQISKMVVDYTTTDTSSFNVSTEALDKVWQDRSAFEKRAQDLTIASANLQKVASSGDEAAIKEAIAGVGKTCGGCHDDFKKD
ncbi:c-type cytochrome [Thalassotalea ganghwensis]